MKRVFLVVISGIFLFLFGAFIAFRITVPDKENKSVEKYFVYMIDKEENNTDYSLELDENGNFNLTVNRRTDTLEGKKEQNNYDIQLSKADYSIVKKVIDYFENTYRIGSKKEYKFYFDYDVHQDKVYPDDKEILLDVIKALENISLGNEKSGEITKKELGEQMLEKIESEL